MTPEIKDLLTPVRIDLKSHDPHDLQVEDVTSFSVNDLPQATHVLIGCPQDQGVRRNHGRAGAAEAPAAIRAMFYRLKPPRNHWPVRLLDLGNIRVDGELEEIHDRLQRVVTAALTARKKVIVLGGGNDISFADGAAMAGVFGETAAVNIDAHLDLRKSPRRHSGTPYRDLLDQGLLRPENLFAVGLQPWANSPEYLSDAEKLGVRITTLAEVRRVGVETTISGLLASLYGSPFFVGLDMDSVRSADAPGVSAPSPLGFTAEEVLHFADACHHHPATGVFEISEVNPAFDRDNCTARLAALAIYTFLYGLR
jgi:formiminoglutamase